MNASRSYSRHGLNVLKAQVKVRGLGALDRRTAAARDLIARHDELVQDPGGDVTAAQRVLIEAATRTRLYVDHLDAFLMAQAGLVNARRRAVIPVLRERQQLVDSLARLLAAPRLERRAPKAVHLHEYVAARYGARGNGHESAASGVIAGIVHETQGCVNGGSESCCLGTGA